MVSKTPHPPASDGDYECVDPEMGSALWRLADPECPEELRRRIEIHVKYCADCRLQLAVERETISVLREDFGLPASGRRVRLPMWATGLGSMALAAGLAILVLMPPKAPHQQLILRGDDGPVIERPVAEEVVLGRRPDVQWTPLPGATRYHVQVEAVTGQYKWSTDTNEPSVRIPPDRDLPAGTRFRVRVEPVPAHVAPDGALSSSFRTGGPGAWLAHRLRHGADAGRGLGAVGLLGILAGVAGLIRWRRPA